MFSLLAHDPVAALSLSLVGMLVGGGLVFVRMLLRQQAAVQAKAERMRPVLKGQIAEQLAPHLAEDFIWSSADARFLGDPIDYVVFDGYADDEEIEVVLVEVKSGNARLSARQRAIRRAVKAGRVRFAEVRL